MKKKILILVKFIFTFAVDIEHMEMYPHVGHSNYVTQFWGFSEFPIANHCP